MHRTFYIRVQCHSVKLKFQFWKTDYMHVSAYYHYQLEIVLWGKTITTSSTLCVTRNSTCCLFYSRTVVRPLLVGRPKHKTASTPFSVNNLNHHHPLPLCTKSALMVIILSLNCQVRQEVTVCSFSHKTRQVSEPSFQMR